MPFGVLAALRAHGPSTPPPPEPRPRKATPEQHAHTEEDAALRALKKAGSIRSLGAIAVEPPMQPLETAYYFGPGKHQYFARQEPLPALPPMPTSSILYLARTTLR